MTHTFNGTNVGDKVIVNGSFDVNVWYSYDNDKKTTVSIKKFNYPENLHLKNQNNLDSNSEVIVRSLKQPTVSDVSINNGVINLNIDKELGIEVVGNTKVKVPVEDVEDDYELVEDDSVEEEIDKVTDNYLK